MEEITANVNWLAVIVGAVLAAALLGEDRVARPLDVQRLDDQRLAGVVDLGHQVDRRGLGAHLEAGLVALALHRARGAGHATGELEDLGVVAHASSE